MMAPMARRPPPRSILITGASSGIGAALARAYARPGARLALAGRDRARLADVAAACKRIGAEVETRAVEVSDRAAMAEWIAGADARAPLDLAIANAGISGGSGGRGEEEAKAREIFAVNLAGALNTIWPAIAAMRPRRRGQIAIVSSIAAFRGLPGAPAYSASKAAVKAYGEAMRGWLKPHGIAVSVVCPGFVATHMTAGNRYRMPLIMDADKAAAIIVRGLARDQARIAFPRPIAFLAWLMGALPPAWTDPIFGRLPNKE